MDVDVFEAARCLLGEIYGSLQEVDNGGSVRCKRAAKGKITLYRRGVASGNCGEVAFDVESMAARAQKSEVETRQFLAGLKAANGRATERHPRYDWPRVGFSTIEEVWSVVMNLKRFFGIGHF
ncbi:hypothetical protein D3C84_216700 [compost metagenome]